MRRGTRVGEAYVALTADGSGLNEDIADSFEDVDFDEIADRHGKKYAERIRGHLNRVDNDFTTAMKKLSNKVQFDADITQGIQHRLAESIDQSKLDELFARVGKRAGISTGTEFERIVKPAVIDAVENAMQDAARSGKQVDLFGSVTKQAEDSVRRTTEAMAQSRKANAEVTERMLENVTRMHEKANADIEKSDNALVKAQQRIYDEAQKRYEQGRKANADVTSRMLANVARMHERANADIEKSDRELVKAQQRILDTARREAIKAEKDMWRVRNQTAKAHIKYLADLERGRINEFGVTLDRVSRNKKFDIGRLFGKGSRNNFLNLFGRSVGGITRLIQKTTGAATSMFSTFSKGFSEAAEGASFFQKVAAGGGAVGTRIGAAFSSMAASGPAAAVAIVSVTLALSIMVSVAGALVGILTALVATITAGLVAALAVAGGAMMALVTAGGLLTAAFMSMTNAQKNALTSAFRPLKAEMVGIAQLMLKDMVPAFATWSANLQRALLLLAPVASVMGRAFAQAGNIFTAALSGPGFQRFSRAMTQELPAITTALSSALGGFLNGLLGIFSALMPQVTRFSRYLADVAARFSKWANSASGQNAIVAFVDRAVDSLLSLWNFVREFTGFVSDVLFSPSAMKTGNNFFDSLAKSFAGFRRNITNGNLEKWFKDSAKFAGDLKAVVKGLGDTFKALYNSGVLRAVGRLVRFVGESASGSAAVLEFLADMMGATATAAGRLSGPIKSLTGVFGPLIDVVRLALGWLTRLGSFNASIPFIGPLNSLIGTLGRVSSAARNAMRDVARLTNMKSGTKATPLGGGFTLGEQTTITAASGGIYDEFSLSNLIGSGTNALNNTYESAGGYMPDPSSGADKQWKNPYKAYAESLIKDGPSVVQQIRSAIQKVNRDIRRGLVEAFKADDRGIARDAINSMIASARETARGTVEAAQDAINSAAQNLSSASSPREAQRALREIRRAQRDMTKAVRAQRRINDAIDLLSKQRTVRGWNVRRLERGIIRSNTTLEEFAVARDRVARKLERANQRLTDAIAMRDNYESAVSSSVRDFGSLMTAQAQTINGVTQALTAGDITSNLTTRLEKIKKFQSDLRLLIAQGLSDAAYKQLVDAGVEQGGQFAEALLSGGLSSISEVNGLVSQINGVADQLGSDASSRLYQAGVDAAQGLVDGLESLSAQLDAAAARLGNQIARAIANALGIRSPSRRLIEMMEEVGDGAVVGLDRQHVKVGNAAARLADQIAVSPEVAAYASRRGTPATEEPRDVSGNGTGDPRFRDLIVNTPTEDPEAVAMEVLNEVTGRI